MMYVLAALLYNIIFLNMGMRAPSRAPDPPASDYAYGGKGAYGVRARSMLVGM